MRGEINQLDRALEQTLARLQEVEGQIARQAQAVDNMAEQAKAGANADDHRHGASSATN